MATTATGATKLPAALVEVGFVAEEEPVPIDPDLTDVAEDECEEEEAAVVEVMELAAFWEEDVGAGPVVSGVEAVVSGADDSSFWVASGVGTGSASVRMWEAVVAVVDVVDSSDVSSVLEAAGASAVVIDPAQTFLS